MVRNGPVRFTARTRDHSARSRSTSRAHRADAGVGDGDVEPPEVLDRVIGESFDVGLDGDIGDDDWRPHLRARQPRAASACSSRSPTTTAPPSLTNRRVTASPMPEAPPVTMATLSWYRPPVRASPDHGTPGREFRYRHQHRGCVGGRLPACSVLTLVVRSGPASAHAAGRDHDDGTRGHRIWSLALRYGDPAAAASHATELEGLGYTALWIPDVGGTLFGPLANLLGATNDGDDRHRHPQRLDAHARGDGGAARRADGRARAAVPVRHRHQPPAAHRPSTRPAPTRSRSPRWPATSTASTPPRCPGQGRPGAGGARAEDARAGPDPHRRHPPVPRHPRAHRQGAGGHRPRRPRRQRAGRRARDRPGPAPGRPPACTSRRTSRCRTTRTTGSARASPTTTSPTAAAIASSTRSWCGATRRPSPPGSRSTATPAPTTCASRC